MRGKFSKKQIGVLGVAVLITAQTPAMAAEESQVQQEETAVVQEVETELSDLVESIPEAESESAETLSEIELQAEELEPEISEAEESQIEQSEGTEDVSEENLYEETESESELQLETEPLNSNVESNEARSADGCWWEQAENGKWRYVYYYAQVYDRVLKIDGNYYGFDYNGYMYQDCSFWNNNTEYIAKADGTLYASEWYQDKDGRWYYYDENAHKVNGIVEIQGKKYLFDNYSGYLKVNQIGYWNDSYYLSNEGGELIQSVGWHKIDNSWYYVKEDGSLFVGLFQDDGYKYYLRPWMTTLQGFISIDGAAYKIDAAGHATPIIEDGFYGEYRGMVYVNNGQILKSCWKNIDGKWYYFNENGYMQISDDRYNVDVHTINIDGKYYYFDANGVMAENGWVYMCTGEWCYAQPSGDLVVGDAWIGGKLYHFSGDGILRTGACEENGTYIVCDEDGTKLGELTHDGWSLIGGNYYYLENGVVMRDGAYKLPDGKWYVFEKSGRMLSSVRSEKRWLSENGDALTGWINRGGAWYYADPDTAEVCTGFQWINGAQYYLKSDGTMLVGEKVIDGKLIMTDDSGAIKGSFLLEDGWSYHDGECYYSKNGELYTGWVDDYYVQNGRMLRNQVVRDSESGKYYWVDEYGVYQTNKWVNEGDSYAKEDGTLAEKEWMTIDGKLYCFYGGQYGVSHVYGMATIDRKEYLFDKNGVYICDVAGMKDGWSLVDGAYYYKLNGSFIVGHEVQINGRWYSFDWDGKMISDAFSPLTNYQEATDTADRNSYYQSGGSRADYVGWQLIDGKWYYFDGNSKCLEGWAVLNGNRYYFKSFFDVSFAKKSTDAAGKTCTGYRTINGVLYYFDQNGICQGACGPQNGWYYADGDWYYMKGGKVITETIGVMDFTDKQVAAIVTINETEYAFDNLTGKMLTDRIVKKDVVRGKYEYIEDRDMSLIYVNADGKVVTTKGWILTKNGYIYVQSNGTLCTGVHMINGIVYYFGADGIWIS